MRRIVIILSLWLAPWLSFSAITSAQETPAPGSPLAKLYECALIQSDAARLACFDTNVGIIKVKEEKQEIVAIDADAAKSIKREAFGFSLPSLPKLGLPSFSGSDEAPETLNLPVKSVRKRGGDYVFLMENGQVWRQVSGRFNYIPKGDLTATIKRASMGSFRISITNGKERVRGMGVRRVE